MLFPTDKAEADANSEASRREQNNVPSWRPRISVLKEAFRTTPLRRWVAILLIAAFAGLAMGMFVIRRRVIEYHPEHNFGVRDPAFFGSAHALSDPLPVAGNKIDLLHNGDGAFPPMLVAIANARKSVNFEAFIFSSDPVGTQFRDALAERARAGVKVRVLLDGLGSKGRLKKEDVKAMREAGCDVVFYHPPVSWRVDRANRRTHRRVLVIDGKIGFTGSVAFSHEWSGNADSPEHWRDLAVRIEGPLVTNLQGAFQQHWVNARSEPLSGDGFFPTQQPAGTLKAQLVASHSFSVAPMPLLQAVSLASAEQRVWITNSYFWPEKDQIEAMAKAARRGVDVRVLVPGPHNDQPMTKAGGRHAFGDLLNAGVKIFEYQPTMIHSKTMVVDGIFSVLGSSNLDARSSEINEELDLTVYDESFARQMEQVFETDLKQSRPYTLQDYQRRTLWERMTEVFATPLRRQY